MAAVQYAHIDYTRDPFHRWQWTFRNNAAGILVQLLGILITIALAQLWILLQSVWLVQYRVRHPAIETLREALNEFSPPVQLPGAPPKARWKVLLLKIALVFFAFVIFIVILALGAFANTLQGDNIVLITSAACGAYKREQSYDYATMSLFETKAQRDAQQYARLCYGGRKLDYGCDQFSHQAIDYQTTIDDDCPWAGGMCHLGAKGAITFKTGPTPASALGINAKHNLQFERSTTCAPVNMNATYITHRKWSDDGCKADVFDYHYGWYGNNDHRQSITYESPREVWPSYSVEADYEEPGSNGFNAMPEMSPPYGAILTMMYIKPGRIFYLAPSDDPIFPATRRLNLSGMDVWQYADGHDRILACVDRVRWRDLEKDQEWHTHNEIPTEPPDRVVGSKWLLFLALKSSNIYQVNSQSEALNASSLLYTYSSSPLYPKQWEIEARQMFEASLARAQLETSYMAKGTYASFPGWVKQSLDIVSPAMCQHTYLGNDPDFANVNGIVYLMILIPCLLIIASSCPWDDKLLWVWALGEDRAGRWAESVVSVTRAINRMVRNLAESLWRGLKWLFSKVRTVLRRFFTSSWGWLSRQQWKFF